MHQETSAEEEEVFRGEVPVEEVGKQDDGAGLVARADRSQN